MIWFGGCKITCLCYKIRYTIMVQNIAVALIILLFMNIISPKNSTGAVSLKQLIPQHESLKLLILHTPFPLQIGTLPRCINLVKLDLSKNSIRVFPFLGNLKYLRIVFIHQNLLGINEFVKIFEDDGKTSVLNENIVWVTYWGNKNVFLARHYLINKTKAIAFDKNIIVQEERGADLVQAQQGFCVQSDITQIFTKRSLLSEYTTQQEYMQDFWHTLRLLRLKYEQANPIIKIQKVFKGWIFREKLRREFQKQKNHYLIMYHCFRQWKNGRKKDTKLKKLLKDGKNTYLLYKSSKINRQYIYNRMKQLAQIAKNKVLKRRLELQNQMKFYSILKGNFKILQDLYAQLQLSQSQAIYIFKDNINEFVEIVVPFVKEFCSQDIQHSMNESYYLHYLHEPISKNNREFIKMIKTNRYSIISYQKPLEKMLGIIKFKKPTAIQTKMKSIFGKVHISTEKREKMLEQERHLQQTKKKQRDQLLRIEGSYELLRTIVRGVYFYNSKRFNLPPNAKYQRINILSQMSLKRISSAVSIQRAWKGFIFRKKHQGELKIILRFQKAAMTIQRWFRRLPNARKKYFFFDIQSKLNECEQFSFYIDFEEYLEQIRMQKQRRETYVMLQQHVQVYKHKQSGDLVVTWDDCSKREQIKAMIDIKRKLFPNHFLAKIGFPQKQIAIKTSYAKDMLERCDITHLFHFKTETSLINRQNKTFIQIQCRSKAQAKFRMMAITLMNYDFKLKKSITFYKKEDFSSNQLRNKSVIAKKQVSIVCNQNMSYVKRIEQNCSQIQNLHIYMISNKIFLQLDINKQPYKVEERFIIYLINHESKAQKLASILSHQQKQHESRYEISQPKANYSSFQTPFVKQFEYHITSSYVEHTKIQQQRKILVKKRSIKQFKAKVKKRQQDHPNFIIDNKSTDRITQNQSYLDNSNRVIDKVDQGPNNRKEISEIRAVMHERAKKGMQSKRKQQDFTKRFINMGNFMQSQFISDHRKRIKTQIQQIARQSAEEVRLSAHRSTSHKEEKLYRKYVKARELEHVHKSMVQQSKALGVQRSIVLRNNVEGHRQKMKQQEKRSIRRPRVSFVEQNFPLVHNKNRNFSIN